MVRSRAEGGLTKTEIAAYASVDQLRIDVEKEFERSTAPLRLVRGELIRALERLETMRSLLDESLERVEDILRAGSIELTSLEREQRRLQGVAALRAVLQEDPAREWRPRDLHAELRVRGWLSRAGVDTAVTQAALHRLFTRGEVDRPKPGHYRWKGDSSAGQRDAVSPAPHGSTRRR